MKRKTLGPVLFVLLVFLLATPADMTGQTATTGAIVGAVTDSTGAVVPEVQLRLFDNASNGMVRSLASGANGTFVFSLLAPGSYRLEAEGAGFRKFVIPNVIVRVTETARTDVKLEVGALEQRVEVSVTPQLIPTESATLGQTVESRAIEELPLVNRNYYQLLSLTPGTSTDLNQAGTSLGRGVTDVQMSGQRTASINYQIQGVNVNDIDVATADFIPLPNPDFLQEFKVSTGLYDATQGRSGGLVNVMIKSGQKGLHGDLFHYFRNDDLNANDVFQKAGGQKRPVLKENQFGGDLGGKLSFGGILFFGGYQGSRDRNGLVGRVSTGIPVLPTDRNAATLGAAFRVDSARVDPVAVKVLNLQSKRYGGPFLIPSVPGTLGSVAPFAASIPAQFRSDQEVVRLDRQWTKDTLFGAFFFDDWATEDSTGGGFGPPTTNDFRNMFYALTWTHLLGARTTNQLRVGYNRIAQITGQQTFFSTQEVGMNSPNATTYPGLPQFSVSGFLAVGGSSGASLRVQNIYSLANDFTRVLSAHTLRAGLAVDQYRFNRGNVSFSVGQLTFRPKADPLTGANLTAMQAFILGLPSELRFARAGPFGVAGTVRLHATDFAWYLQDDWAVTRRFKLNLGLRLESMGQFFDAEADRISVFDIADYAAGGTGFKLPENFNLAGIKGTQGIKRCGLNECRNLEWAPRVGLAYDLFGNGRTILRAGWGLYYHRATSNPILQATSIVPFSAAAGISTNLVGLADPFSVVPLALPIVPGDRPKFTGLRPNVCAGGSCFQFPLGWATPAAVVLQTFHPPRTNMWNFSMGQVLPRNWGLEIAYAGAKATSLINWQGPNQPLRVSPSKPLTVLGTTITTNTINNAWLRAPLLGLDPGGLRVLDNSAYSIYHSLQASLVRRMAPLFFLLGYTWSKSIDTGSPGGAHADRLFRGGSRSGQEISQLGAIGDQSNFDNQRSVSDYDRTHRLTVSFALDLPTPKFAGTSSMGRAVMKGWVISAVTVYQSGSPYSVFDRGGGAAFGAGPSGFTRATANPVGAGPILVSTNPSQYLDASQFAPAGPAPGGGPADTDFGVLGRNTFRSPFQQNWDLSLAKNFPITEARKLEFRAAFYNLFNHPIFDVPDNGFTDVQTINRALIAQGKPQPNFGVARSTVTQPRIVQLSLRFHF